MVHPVPAESPPTQVRRDRRPTVQRRQGIGAIWADRESPDNLHWFLGQPLHIMLESSLGVSLNHDILHCKLLPSRPSDDGLRNLDALLIWQRDGEREHSPWPHGQIARESPADTRKIPDGPLSVEWPRVVGDGALDGKATKGTNREGHGYLAGRRIIVEGLLRKAQELRARVSRLCFRQCAGQYP